MYSVHMTRSRNVHCSMMNCGSHRRYHIMRNTERPVQAAKSFRMGTHPEAGASADACMALLRKIGKAPSQC